MNGTQVNTFVVSSFRKIPNPYLQSEEGEKDSAMFVAICDVTRIPDDIPMETNPREQNLITGVAKKIKASLLNTSEPDFYLLNRGLLISAKSVSFNTYTHELTLVFDDTDVHGDVDGGHTYRIILENRQKIDEGQQYVKLEILTGIEGIFQKLAAARNTSVQVKDQSIAELEDRFDLIKAALNRTPYISRVFFKENDAGDIDVADITAILNLFNIDRYQGMASFPINSYSSRKKCIDIYIAEHRDKGEDISNPYVKMRPIMTDIFKLYDAIESNMSAFYRRKNPNGRYGSTKGVNIPKAGDEFETKFLQTELDVMSPNGFIYPILGAFRAIVEERNSQYVWKEDPFETLDKIGGELVDSVVTMSRALGNNPQSVGKDANIWKTLYMTVAFSTMQ